MGEYCRLETSAECCESKFWLERYLAPPKGSRPAQETSHQVSNPIRVLYRNRIWHLVLDSSYKPLPPTQVETAHTLSRRSRDTRSGKIGSKSSSFSAGSFLMIRKSIVLMPQWGLPSLFLVAQYWLALMSFELKWRRQSLLMRTAEESTLLLL